MNDAHIVLITLFIFTQSLSAKTLSANNQAGTPYVQNPVFIAIQGQLKPFGSYAPAKVKEEEVAPAPKVMSRGQKMIEEAKARNRAILQGKKESAKDETNLSELDKLKLENKKGLEEMKAEADKNLNDWKEEIKKQREIWKEQQDIFYGRIKVYKENTFILPVKKEKIVEKKLVESIPESLIVANAFDIPVRDQMGRPTCAAFAGIRVAEILLAQNGLKKDLSSQYLYWASKPKCQKSPCSDKGSWVTSGFDYSEEQNSPDIPLESTCSYQKNPEPNNETQVPLSNECRVGFVKVEKYEAVKTLSEVIETLKKQIPVVMGAKLSGNFYQNEGLVTLADSKKNFGLKLDGHAQGHAFVAVGFHELPEAMKSSEGAYCIIIANSWGEGYGAGGYTCLTENWLKQYRIEAPFVALTQINVKD